LLGDHILTVLSLSTELMLYVLIGIYLQKRGIVNSDFEPQLANFLLEAVLPLLIIRSVQFKLTAEVLRSCGHVVLFSIGSIAFFYCVGYVLWRLLGKGSTGRIFRFSCIFTNFTFIGLPVMSAVFDQQAVFLFSIYVIPIRIVLYLTCEAIMTPPERYAAKKGAEVWKRFCSAPLIAVIAGLALCLFGWKIHAPLDTVMKNVGALSLPLGMILCGLIAGRVQLPQMRQIFGKKTVGLVLLRNILLPAIVLLACKLCNCPAVIMRVAVIYAALPVGTLLSTFASKYDGGEQARNESVGAVILSSVPSVLTIPIWVGILTVG